MHLIVYHVVQLDHVDDTNCSLLVEALTGFAIVEIRVAEFRQTGFFDQITDFLYGRTVEDWRGKLHTQLLAGPAQNGFIDLAEVHTAWYTERVQNDINRRSVFEERHVFRTYDTCNDTLVTVAAGHLITHLQLTLGCEINLGELQYTCRQLITDREVELLTLVAAELLVKLDVVVVQQLVDHIIRSLLACPGQRVYGRVINRAERLRVELAALADHRLTKIVGDTS